MIKNIEISDKSFEIFQKVIDFIRHQFNAPSAFIPLHEPRFFGNERKYVLDSIDSTYVSSVGKYVNDFEDKMKTITGSKYAIATVNGTASLHMALILIGAKEDCEIITQPLSFIATLNAIAYTRANPVFVDVDKDTLSMSPESLESFLREYAIIKKGESYNRITGKRILACIPMHTFGFMARIDEIVKICNDYGIIVIEDAAESLGSTYRGKPAGTFGTLGTFSFNGNKTVTAGGGGALITNDESLAKLAKHLTTTAKVPHPWEYFHDQVGYNYRMPNLNAALVCAQLEQLGDFMQNKRELSNQYEKFFQTIPTIQYIIEGKYTRANYWLMTILLSSRKERDQFLEITNSNKIMTRPAWCLMNKLPMYKHYFSYHLDNALWLEDRLVNLPSSVRLA